MHSYVRSIRFVTAFLLPLLLATGCEDDKMDSVVPPGDDTISAIAISGEDCYYTLPADGRPIVSVTAEDGGFVTVVDNGTVYFEQNDEPVERRATLDVEYDDGSRGTLHFAQKPVSRSASGCQFMRHHGIGYSYNAVEGRYCDMSDFRCQILNRAMLEKYGQTDGYNFLISSNLNEMHYTHESYSSVVDYIQHSNVYAGASGDIVLFSGDATMSCSLFEEGTKSSYILKNEVWIDRAEYSLDEAGIREYAGKYPSMLTSSFRYAVSNIHTLNDVDDFLYKYGTHVVVYSKLGARLTLEVQVDTHKFDYREQAEAMAGVSIATLFKMKSESSSQTHNYEILRDGKCRLSILGGDLSYLDKVIDLSSFNTDGTAENMVTDWIGSVYHNDSDITNSNVEMTDMEVVPIWEFIPDRTVAELVEGRVMGNAALLAESFGNKNFINTSFDLNPGSVRCRINGEWRTFSDPDVIDIISSNRHVATVCREYVPEIAGNGTKVHVAYPIYEGRVQLDAGLCVHNGKAYDVAWNGYKFFVKERDDAPSGNLIYINMGALSTKKADNLPYVGSHAILGCERPGGVLPDGTIGGTMLKVYKHFGHFYLENKNRYTNLPGWSWMDAVPLKEYEAYPTFFPSKDYPGRMWRDADYVYIYNPREVSYE